MAGMYRTDFRRTADAILPEDRRTVFFRGFSIDLTTSQIQKYFEQEIGRCTVEFEKIDPQVNMNFVALKFDSQETAKSVLEEFDESACLGCKIYCSFYKDHRSIGSKFPPPAPWGGRGGMRGGRGGAYPMREQYDGGSRFNRSFKRDEHVSRSYSRSSDRSGSSSSSRSSPDVKRKKRKRTPSISRSPTPKRKIKTYARDVSESGSSKRTKRGSKVANGGDVPVEEILTHKMEIIENFKTQCENVSAVTRLLIDKKPALASELQSLASSVLKDLGNKHLSDIESLLRPDDE